MAARVDKEGVPDVKIYPATTIDAVGFYIACCTNLIHMEGKQSMGTTIAFRTIVPALMILDTPISLVTDTAFLPYDLYSWGKNSTAVETPNHTIKAGEISASGSR